MLQSGSFDDLRRCPYLGLNWDRTLTALYYSPEHRCYAGSKPRVVGTLFQSETCLTSTYFTCPLYSQAQAPRVAPSRPGWDRRRALTTFLGLLLAGFGLGIAAGLLWGAL